MKQKLNLREMVKEIIKEEQKTAWLGRFENLDKILSSNYDQMSASDQTLKDTLFSSYYRYFNDGDVITFPLNLLKKIGCDPSVMTTLSHERGYVKHMKTPMKLKRPGGGYNYRRRDTKDNPSVQKYEQAMEKVIISTIKYFKNKYPNFFNAAGRKKTITQWKTEILKYAQSKPTELDTYWVGEFGEQFGKPELAKYKKLRNTDKVYKIDDPTEITNILKIMSQSIKGS